LLASLYDTEEGRYAFLRNVLSLPQLYGVRTQKTALLTDLHFTVVHVLEQTILPYLILLS
jgi:hypothetical protein